MSAKTPSLLVSFSGIDGAGKGTQIEHLKSMFEQRGLTVRVIAFWDQIATLKRVRESAGHSIFKGDKGVGSPSAPIEKRDKNVRSFPMTVVRLGMYLLDAMSNRRAAKRAAHSGVDLVIFDRYIYDELANLELSNGLMRLYARVLLKLVPRPDISYLLDADPQKARARKPEYPLDFLVLNRQAYVSLSELAGMVVMSAAPIDEVKQAVVERAAGLLEGRLRAENSWIELDEGVVPTEPAHRRPA
ncbi:MAG TPA: thymidylate kinase [Terracidiphilus sp.]|nr:thymidylate kinase [Terracidiphilus sp.]